MTIYKIFTNYQPETKKMTQQKLKPCQDPNIPNNKNKMKLPLGPVQICYHKITYT